VPCVLAQTEGNRMGIASEMMVILNISLFS
jgi:hypothetical protein